jgi:hypothetical protein
MNEDILNQIVDDYYSDCPCVDTNQESIETYGNDDSTESNKDKNRFDFWSEL